MVVLEGGGMLATGSNQYLQPDYLSPLPTTLDAKKSPLALLAQTCSQIGADSPPSKPLIPPLEKPKKSSGGGGGGGSGGGSAPAAPESSPAPEKAAAEKPARSSPPETRLAFKPYEANVLSKKPADERPPSSRSGAAADEEKSKGGSRAPSRKSASPPGSGAAPGGGSGAGSAANGGTPAPASGPAAPADSKAASERGKSVSPAAGGGGASPIIRSGLEILHGHPKDVPLGTYKPGSAGLSAAAAAAAAAAGLGAAGLGGALGALCSGCPPGLEASNPAFRPPFAGGPFSHQHAALLAASAGYGAAPGPYVSYARVKTAAGGEALVPVCKDPYCTGCQYSAAHQHMLLGAAAAAAAAAAACPSGCTQCDHQKYAGLLPGLVPGAPGTVPPPLPYSQLGRPYVCNWIAGESYCGKRFASSDELLQHLRSHTGLGAADGAAAAAAAAAAAGGPMSSLLSPHSLALHRAAYPNPPLSPLSAAAAAARYHPYSKPGGAALPASLPASPFSAFNPTALGPYYSPYSLYGQRLGAAAVHP